MQHSALQQSVISSTRSLQGRARTWLPGLTLATLLALLAFLAADSLTRSLAHLGPIAVSPIILALLLGIGIRNGIGLDESFDAGLRISQCRILQVGIALLGIRLSFSEFAVIGIGSLPLIVICIGVALLTVNYLGKKIGLSPQLATLIAAGTSICGATAIVVTAPIVKARGHEISYAIACITVFGIIATLVYPVGSYWLFGTELE